MCVYPKSGSRVLPLSGASSFLAWLSFFVWRLFMYLLYADDSGVTSDPNVYNKELRDGGTVQELTSVSILGREFRLCRNIATA